MEGVDLGDIALGVTAACAFLGLVFAMVVYGVKVATERAANSSDEWQRNRCNNNIDQVNNRLNDIHIKICRVEDWIDEHERIAHKDKTRHNRITRASPIPSTKSNRMDKSDPAEEGDDDK